MINDFNAVSDIAAAILLRVNSCTVNLPRISGRETFENILNLTTFNLEQFRVQFTIRLLLY